MADSITVRILGDAPLFSKAGKGFSYAVSCGGSTHLVDCGANVFDALTPKELVSLDGIFITHAHSDHVRYLADLAFYLYFSTRRDKPLRIIATDEILAQVGAGLRDSMETTLTPDRRFAMQIPYEDFIESVPIGPEALYVIEPPNPHRYDSIPSVRRRTSGANVPPHKAKVCIEPRTRRQSILFYDTKTKCWVDPECFYDFSSKAYYEEEQREYHDGNAGLKVVATKMGIWHGIESVGYKFHHGESSVLITGDTAADLDLWRRLATEKIRLSGMKSERFLKARLVGDDPAHFIERVWSAERIEGLGNLYGGTATFHECGGDEKVVHTGYAPLERLWSTAVGEREKDSSLVLTHTPSQMVSRFPIAMPGQKYVIEGGKLAGHSSADYYVKDGDSLHLAYRDSEGGFCIAKAKAGEFERLVLSPWSDECGGSCARVRIATA
jgi:hypothetical protein